MVFKSPHPRVRELSFQTLLNEPIGGLELRPADVLRACLIQLRRELKKQKIAFFPHFYFGEEPWGCIDRTGSVGVPFFLANNALRRIAERYYYAYSKKDIMMYLRHEAGHALNYAYKLWIRPDWRETFGPFHKTYRSFYNHDPYSKDYVRYLHFIGNPHYAQKHPDEDFAETFAVWLDPASKWKWNYRRWKGALHKLRYIDRLFRRERVAEHRPLRVRYNESDSYRNIRSTIAEYFEIEKKVDPRIKEYTQDLKEIFLSGRSRSRRTMRADLFIRNYGEHIEDELVAWLADADRRIVRSYLREVQTICRLHNLRVHPDHSTEKLVELVIVSTYHVLNKLKRIR